MHAGSVTLLGAAAADGRGKPKRPAAGGAGQRSLDAGVDQGGAGGRGGLYVCMARKIVKCKKLV